MKSTNSRSFRNAENARARSKTFLSAALLGAVLLSSVCVAMAQVYGVKRTTVVRGPNTTVVASKTTVVHAPNTTVVAGRSAVVAGGGGLPHGYIAVLPGGYRAVYVSGVRYYTVGGMYYRAQIYQGRTVYVVAHV